jgi:hypothetical protein
MDVKVEYMLSVISISRPFQVSLYLIHLRNITLTQRGETNLEMYGKDEDLIETSSHHHQRYQHEVQDRRSHSLSHTTTFRWFVPKYFPYAFAHPLLFLTISTREITFFERYYKGRPTSNEILGMSMRIIGSLRTYFLSKFSTIAKHISSRYFHSSTSEPLSHMTVRAVRHGLAYHTLHVFKNGRIAHSFPNGGRFWRRNILSPCKYRPL